MGKKRDRVRRLFEDKPLKETKHYSRKGAAAALSIISVVLCVLTVLGVVFLRTYFSDTDVIKAWVDENYLLGIVVMTLLCALQVVIALIPGELLEIAAGYAFGGWMGALVCTVGITLGSVIAILLARKLGRRFVESLYPRDKIDAFPILRDKKKRNTMAFILFLIPGTPKDLFTYVIGLTEMSIPLYIVITTVARFPSIIMSTVGGGALGDNKFMFAAVVFMIAGVVSGVGYLLYLIIQSRYKAKHEESCCETENE